MARKMPDFGVSYTEPLLPLLFAVALAGVIRRRNGRHLLGIAIVGFLLVSWPVMDWMLSRPLEMRYPARPFQAVPVQGIVVLASGVRPPTLENPYPLPNVETYERCMYAARLHRLIPTTPVVVSGGPEPAGGEPYSLVMRRLLEQSGIPPGLIWTEERSTSTHESALFTSKLLRERGIRKIALVVEATNMTRAEACFRKEGLVVVAAPCSFRQLGAPLSEFLPGWRAIRHNEAILHETLGYFWYWLRGWV